MAEKYPIDPVKLCIDGTEWTYWTGLTITRQVDAIAGSFDLELVERWGDAQQGMEMVPLAAGLSCTVAIGDDQVIKGYIDKISPQFAANAHGIRVSGRDASADLVDCSAVNKPGQWKGLDAGQLAAELAKPFNVPVTVEGDVGAPFESWKLEPGEKAFDSLDRALKQRELFACPDGKGGIVILKIGSRENEGKLEQGVNVLSASLDADMTQRFSDYIVQGQQPGKDDRFGLAACAVTAETKDEAVKRYRPMIIKAENSVDAAGARQRAAWECSVRAGRAVTVRVTVQGFRQKGVGLEQSGPLWQINAMTECKLPYLRLEQRLLTSKVTFKRSLSGGSTTELELRDPAAFKPEPKTEKKGGGGNGKGGGGGSANLTVAQEKDIQTRMADDAAAANKKAGS